MIHAAPVRTPAGPLVLGPGLTGAPQSAYLNGNQKLSSYQIV
jgi:hypothetical protein